MYSWYVGQTGRMMILINYCRQRTMKGGQITSLVQETILTTTTPHHDDDEYIPFEGDHTPVDIE